MSIILEFKNILVGFYGKFITRLIKTKKYKTT